MALRAVDAVLIGGGATASALARDGMRAVLVEPAGPAGEASGADAGPRAETA